MLRKILLGLVLVIAILATVVAVQPGEFRVSRSVTIAAPANVVFTQINDLHAWDGWSPWAKIDPNAKNSYEGPQTGTGAAMKWSGNDQIGEGKMTITESRSPEFVRFHLEFVRPMSGSNTAEFNITPNGDKTTVTWSMFGPKNFWAKAFGLIVDCDKMVGGEFEKGLLALKQIAEKAA